VLALVTTSRIINITIKSIITNIRIIIAINSKGTTTNIAITKNITTNLSTATLINGMVTVKGLATMVTSIITINVRIKNLIMQKTRMLIGINSITTSQNMPLDS
jgi:hypothetical protein